jgi:putative ABC transport system permease protein
LRAASRPVYGITPHDPFTLASGAAILFAVALAAMYHPARRATRIDPISAIGFE